MKNLKIIYVFLIFILASCYHDNKTLSHKSETSSPFNGALVIIKRAVKKWEEIARNIQNIPDAETERVKIFHNPLNSFFLGKHRDLLKEYYFRIFAPEELMGLDEVKDGIEKLSLVKARKLSESQMLHDISVNFFERQYEAFKTDPNIDAAFKETTLPILEHLIKESKQNYLQFDYKYYLYILVQFQTALVDTATSSDRAYMTPKSMVTKVRDLTLQAIENNNLRSPRETFESLDEIKNGDYLSEVNRSVRNILRKLDEVLDTKSAGIVVPTEGNFST